MASSPLRIAVLGDSLFDRYRFLNEEQALHNALERRLNARGNDVEVFDFAVTGSTTRDGVNRLNEVLAVRPDAVIVELGTNDSLGSRGPVSPGETRSNLEQIITRLQAADVEVLLVGTKAGPGAPGGWPEPVNGPNQPGQSETNAYWTLGQRGIDYTYTPQQAAEFKSIYAQLADRYDVDYYADILGDTIYRPGLTFDGLHPTAEGVQRIVAGLLPDVEELVRDAHGSAPPPVAGVVRGTPGADTLFAPVDGGRVVAGAGNDRVIGRGGDDDRLFGDFGRDTLSGGAGDDRIFAAAGNDILNGLAGDDLLAGGGGNDRYLTGRNGGFDTVADGGGFDRLQFVDLVSSDVTLARDGNDLLARLDGGGVVVENHFAGRAVEQIAFGAGPNLDILDAGEINRLVQQGNNS